MFFNNSEEDKMASNEKKIRELTQTFEEHSHEMKTYFTEIGVSPEEIATFMKERENFTEKAWQIIEEGKEKMDQQLEKELSNVPNPKKTRDKYKELEASQFWLSI